MYAKYFIKNQSLFKTHLISEAKHSPGLADVETRRQASLLVWEKSVKRKERRGTVILLKYTYKEDKFSNFHAYAFNKKL